MQEENFKYEVIKKWPDVYMHLRNIHVALHVSLGMSKVNVGKKYNISAARAGIIYRVLTSYLFSKYFNEDYRSIVKNKIKYNNPLSKILLWGYLDFYTKEKNLITLTDFSKKFSDNE